MMQTVTKGTNESALIERLEKSRQWKVKGNRRGTSLEKGETQ